jgi:putative ATP-dependent endonuclease of OLD family
MEEPENNLSHTNMAKLIGSILKSRGKQIFIATHSSYVANKLSLEKLFLIRNGKAKPFSSLPKETYRYREQTVAERPPLQNQYVENSSVIFPKRI